MFGLTIFLLVILFIFWLLSCNVKFVITFENEMSMYIKYLFFKFNVKSISKKEKNVNNKDKTDNSDNAHGETGKCKTKRKKKNDSGTKNKIKEIIDEKGVWGFLKIAKNFIVIVKNFSSYLLKHICVVKFDLEVKISEENSAQTAIKYGQACAVLYPAINFIFRNISVKDQEVKISPDFNGEKSSVYFASAFKIRLIYILISSFIAFIKLIKNFI